jgi:methionyl-tRNA formyltransferase
LIQLKSGYLKTTSQDETLATYSIWRDEYDYIIDWSKSAEYIKRFIDAVGYPYKGAFTTWGNTRYYIKDSFVVEDVVVENRVSGKVLFNNDISLIIVCGSGLLGVKDFFDETSMIRLTQTRMKIHHANSIRLIKNKLFTYEKQTVVDISPNYNIIILLSLFY